MSASMRGLALPGFLLVALVFAVIGYIVGREDARPVIDVQARNLVECYDIRSSMMEFYEVSNDRRRMVMAEADKILTDARIAELKERVAKIKASEDWPMHTGRVSEILSQASHDHPSRSMSEVFSSMAEMYARAATSP